MNFIDFGIPGGIGIPKSTIDTVYYDSGIHSVWAPFADSFQNLFEGLTTGAANLARGIGSFVNSDSLTLLVLVAGCGVVVYGISIVYNKS